MVSTIDNRDQCLARPPPWTAMAILGRLLFGEPCTVS